MLELRDSGLEDFAVTNCRAAREGSSFLTVIEFLSTFFFLLPLPLDLACFLCLTFFVLLRRLPSRPEIPCRSPVEIVS